MQIPTINGNGPSGESLGSVIQFPLQDLLDRPEDLEPMYFLFPDSTTTQGAYGVLVEMIMCITSLSLHFLESIWSSVKNVPNSRLALLPATAFMASSGMFKKNLTTTAPMLVRYLSKFLVSL